MKSHSALSLLLAGCLAGGAPRAERRVPSGVTIAEFKFKPAEVTVKRGDTLVWTNQDAFFHTTTADSGAWASAELPRGGRFTYVALRTGQFRYHCAAHPAMQALVVVRE